LLILETIDLNGIQSLYSLANKLNLSETLPSKVTIWKLRNSNPMRKSYIKNKIKLDEFEALIKLAAEMSKYLYPYMRNILQSRDDFDKNPVIWNDFKTRFMELINERFNIDSMKVKKLLDPNVNDVILTKSLLTLSFCVSDDGFQKLRVFLLNI
tara:strand:- start:25 stop:486 length:462 start_codon:yes stop_codon:yes gene_type:complete